MQVFLRAQARTTAGGRIVLTRTGEEALGGRTMLQSHMAALEKFLLAYAQIQENTGHSLHKGTPREFFVNEFLRDHLSENVAIGTGEVIDCNSLPSQDRNQMDIVLYKRSFPKLAFGGGISGFLVESVLATVEVKSTLTEKDLRSAFEAA